MRDSPKQPQPYLLLDVDPIVSRRESMQQRGWDARASPAADDRETVLSSSNVLVITNVDSCSSS